ncbi:MAG: RNA polymerase sigma factor [Lachnospiraceae bacterium]
MIQDNLIERIAHDDMAAFEELYRATDKTVYAYILSIIKNPEDAQDIMQDTYLKIRSAAHLYQNQGKPLAWIFTIARNLCLMKMRTNQRVSDTPLEDLEGTAELTSSGDFHSEDRIVLEAALQILSQQEREIVMLHAVSGLKHHEIASSLSLPLSTVLSKYNRALKKLKKNLTERE